MTKQICIRCVGEQHLAAALRADSKKGQCAYCNRRRKGVGIETLADHVERAFEDHYERTPSEPNAFESMMMRDKEESYEWGARRCSRRGGHRRCGRDRR